MYRDSGNYKYWGAIIFVNPELIRADELTQRANEVLYDGLFIASQVNIPELFPSDQSYPSEDDHCFHEFVDFEATQDQANDPLDRTAKSFLDSIEMENRSGWKAFDPQKRMAS
jgi:hypothetical protein